MNEIVLTPAALLDILQQIDELSEYPISVSEQSNGIKLSIGDSVYDISTAKAEPVEVPKDVVDTVRDVNDETYDQLGEADDVEAGILKEIVKSLLVGGMVRLTTKLLGGKK